MNSRPILFAGALAFFLGISTELHAGSVLCRFEYKGASKGEITVESAFEQVPSWGYLPVRVTIVNGSSKPRDWTLRFSSFDGNYDKKMSVASAFKLNCAGDAEAVHEILVPLATALNDAHRQEIQVKVNAPGLAARQDIFYGEFSRDWPAIAISDDLARKNLSALGEKVKMEVSPAYANERFGHRFTPADLPSDWRGLAAIDALMITDSEWRALRPGVRRAILQWNRFGGYLHLYSAKDPATLDDLGFPGSILTTSTKVKASKSSKTTTTVTLPPVPRAKRSLGHIDLHRWDGSTLDVEKTFAIFGRTSKSGRHLHDGYDSNWGLRDDFGDKSFNRALILFVLLAYGILVGPVNFWVLAKPGHRHRLFVTTPLLSLGASFIMAIMIFMSDGVGGAGTRFTVVNLEPDPGERRAFIIQEQFARTGLLLSRSFSLKDDAVISPVNLAPSSWSQFDKTSRRQNTLRVQGRNYAGDWFRSRSETGHFLRAVRTTRARIENRGLTAEGAPDLFSSLGFDIESLFYIDDSGAVWKTTSATVTGSPIALAKSGKAELKVWWKEKRSPGSSALRGQLARLTSQSDLFFAVTSDPAAAPITTGNYIRWENAPLLLFGHLLPPETPTAP